jgi:hypothetical protein
VSTSPNSYNKQLLDQKEQLMMMLQGRTPHDQIQMVITVINSMKTNGAKKEQVDQYMTMLQELRSRVSAPGTTSAAMYQKLLARATTPDKCSVMIQQFVDILAKINGDLDDVNSMAPATQLQNLHRYKGYREARNKLEDRYVELLRLHPASPCNHVVFAPPPVVAKTHVADTEEARPNPINPITFEDVERCSTCHNGGLCTAVGCEWAWIQSRVLRSIPNATVERFEHVRGSHLKERYLRHRDEEVRRTSIDNNANEVYCFHGTGVRNPKKLILQEGELDPCMGKGGFYGKGTYLAVDPCYPIAGRYAHRTSGSSNDPRPDLNGSVCHLLVVKLSAGTACDMGSRVDYETMRFNKAPVRVPSQPPVYYNSIKAGPHTHDKAGDGVNASVMYVCYEKRAMLVEFVVQIKLPCSEPTQIESPATACSDADAADRLAKDIKRPRL